MQKVGWRKSNIGKIYRREFLLPHRKVVKGGAKSGVLRLVGRYHMYVGKFVEFGHEMFKYLYIPFIFLNITGGH